MTTIKINTWISFREHGIRVYGIVTAIDAGCVTAKTSLGEYTLPCSKVNVEPDYNNPELFDKLTTKYSPTAFLANHAR